MNSCLKVLTTRKRYARLRLHGHTNRSLAGKSSTWRDMAKKIVTGEREQQYGKPEDNFRIIGELWKIYLDNKYGTVIDITAEDVALMKNARIMTGIYKEDSYIDLCGYAACAGEIAAKNAKEKEKND